MKFFIFVIIFCLILRMFLVSQLRWNIQEFRKEKNFNSITKNCKKAKLKALPEREINIGKYSIAQRFILEGGYEKSKK